MRLAITLLTALVLSLPGTVRAAEEASTTTDRAAAHATRFRLAHGLASDEAYVRDSLISTAMSSERFGLPLTRDEVADLDARLVVQASLHNGATEYAQSLPGYAGVFIDQLRKGRPVFYFASAVDRGEIAARLPSGTAFDVGRVTRSYADLLALKEQIAAEMTTETDLGVEIVSIGISTSNNAVLVGVASDPIGSEAKLSDRFGSGVKTVVRSKGRADTCQTIDECWGPKGGFSIDPCTAAVASCTLNAPYGANCTSGFMVRRADNALGLITAGHCMVRSAQGPNGAGGTSAGQGKEWRHNQHLLGQAARNTWFAGSGADVGYVGIYSNRWPAVKNELVYDGSPIFIDQVNSAPNWGLQAEGELVCRVGRSSGRDCGDILARDELHPSCLNGQLNCRNIDHEFVVDFDSTGGDSGGPVFTLGVNVEAYGIHTHSEDDANPNAVGWYSTISMARAQYNTTAGMLWNVCVTASC